MTAANLRNKARRTAIARSAGAARSHASPEEGFAYRQEPLTATQSGMRAVIAIPRPLEGRYGVMLAIAILALVPFILLTTAAAFLSEQVSRDLAASQTGLAVISGIATAGYAFGALLGGDLINRFPQRSLFLVCEGMFVLGCLLAAIAGGTLLYGAGSVLTGFATGLLLVVALPPVIRRFPAGRLPVTAIFINIGFFGAVTAGPLIGGLIAAGHGWRWLYAALAGVGIGVLIAALLSLPDQEPQNPGLRFDKSGIALGLGATVLPFWAAGELTGHGFDSFLFAVPMAVGLACLVALLVTEYHKDEPLSPVKQMWHTLPVIGTLTAMVGGGAFVTFLTLAAEFLLKVEHRPPLEAGFAFWPQVLGVIATACLLGLLLRTRYLPVLVLAGMAALMAGGALLLGLESAKTGIVIPSAAALLGLGAGGTVSPALFLAAFSLSSRMVGRAFALVELIRSVADFILAPVMVEIARLTSGEAQLTAHGIHNAVLITLVITGAASLFGLALYLTGGVGLPQPDLEGWLEGDQPAIVSPRLGEKLRRPEESHPHADA
jgi:MFS family permease